LNKRGIERAKARLGDSAYNRRRRDRRLNELYGIGIEDYDRILAGQGGGCAICDKPPVLVGRMANRATLVVDHDHETGAIRGLLCNPCNLMMGRYDSDPDFVSRLLDYVQRDHRVAAA